MMTDMSNHWLFALVGGAGFGYDFRNGSRIDLKAKGKYSAVSFAL